ncbi:hypothetical protein CAEBREN_13907 [Caenorhabditis brenneri]|uniref:PH domain-containing protein n=1 Tax=Caenorhabditis brenneri TaxID=135651 RepID=G0M6T9_CAEBE|nr:hypothetical protein CAEBREN_13907 [Caenorhabditis brenneri]
MENRVTVSENRKNISDIQEPLYQSVNKKRDVIIGINSTFSSETICTSEPILKPNKKPKKRMSRSTNDTTELTRFDSSDSGGVSIGDPTAGSSDSLRHMKREHSSEYQLRHDYAVMKTSQSTASVGTPSKEIEMSLENDIDNYAPSCSSEYYITRKDFGKPEPQLANVLKEFYWKEVVYAKDMKLMNESFFNRVKDHVVDCRFLKELFGSLKELPPIHQPFLDALKDSMHEPDDSKAALVAPVLLATVHNLTPLYQSLVQNFPIYISALDQLYRSKLTFRTIMSKFESSKECYTQVNWLLLKILNRLINWQPVLARVIEVQLAECGNDTETTAFGVAMDKIIEFAKKTKATRQSLEEYIHVLQVERDTGLVGILTHPNRKVLRVGFVLRSARRSPCCRIMVLCSDRILFGHRGPNLDGNFFTVHAEFKLKGMMIDEGDTYKVMDGEKDVITLHNADISIVFAAPDRASWIEDITEAIKNAARAKIDLPSLVMEKKEENDIDMTKVLLPDESPVSKMSPLQICWYRKCSFGRKDVNKMITNTMCGYLKRKLRNSAGWQDLWVVMCCHTLYFYRNHNEREPLAHLSLMDYGVGLPSVVDNIDNHENCFKLFYGSHTYFFRTDSYYFFERWVDSIFQAAISRDSLDVVTALALRI